MEVLSLLFTIIPLIIAVIFHEVAHGFLAFLLGDNTAKLSGRITLNPIAHIDAVGSIILPAMLIAVGSPFVFGYAKPVPVNFHILNRVSRMLVAAAGPLANVILAYIFSLIAMWSEKYGMSKFIIELLITSVFINMILCFFNLIPILPLDGGRILSECLPNKMKYYFSKTESIGMFLLIAIFLLNKQLINLFGNNFDLLSYLVFSPAIKFSKWLLINFN